MKAIAIVSVFLAAGLVAGARAVASGARPGTSPSPVVSEAAGELTPGGVFNVLTYAAPEDVPLASTGLREAGLAVGPIIRQSDEIRIFSGRDAMNAAPLARIWLNLEEGGGYWFHTGGEGSAEAFVIPKGAAVVVWTRASTRPVAWKNVFK